MIRILHVVTIMNRAGLESRLMDIYRNIDRQLIQFDFYTNRTTEGEFDSEINQLGGRVFYSAPIRVGKEYKKYQGFRDFLLNHREYDIVHSHVNEWSTIFCKAAKQANVAVRIAHSRGANKSVSIKTVYKNIIRLPIKHYATHCFAVSKEAGIHLFGKKFVQEGKAYIWPNAIDTSKFRFNIETRKKIREEYKIDDNLVIMHVGNFTHAKNHMFLLEIFKSIKKLHSGAMLFLVGDGEQRNNIEQWIANNKLGKSIVLLGKRSDVPQLLMAADLFVFPSLHEGFPGAVLEAETSGLKCFISDCITEEVAITDSVKMISLKESSYTWAKEILSVNQSDRRDRVEEIKSAGYDIKSLAMNMEKFYLDVIPINCYK